MNFTQFSFDRRIAQQIKAVGYETPTPIQQQAIPVVLKGHDIIGLAQTGTGKTAAFMLPVLQHLTKGSLRHIRALVVAPTRELAEQICQASKEFGRKTKLRSVSIYGGVSKHSQIKQLRKGAEILVACPGRLLDLVKEGHVDLSKVEILVLDEADRMCDMGFLPDIRRILKLLPEKRQTLFFSATMPKEIRQLADKILNNPVTVQIDKIAPAKTVSHVFFPVAQKAKKKLLFALLQQTSTGRVLIFTRTKYRARNLARDMDRRDYRVAALQGNMSQNQRQRAINGFRDGKFDILVATDVAARGIDVSDISHVINFDIPDTVDAYTHRIGRTGRAEQSGEAFTFMGQSDWKMVRDIERLVGCDIERRKVTGFDYGEVEFASLLAKPPRQKAAKPKSHNGRNGSGHSRGRSRRRTG